MYYTVQFNYLNYTVYYVELYSSILIIYYVFANLSGNFN